MATERKVLRGAKGLLAGSEPGDVGKLNIPIASTKIPSNGKSEVRDEVDVAVERASVKFAHLKKVRELRVEFDFRKGLLTSLGLNLKAMAEACIEDILNVDRLTMTVKSTDAFVAEALDEKYTSPLQEIEDQVRVDVHVRFQADLPAVDTQIQEWFSVVEKDTSEKGVIRYIVAIPFHHVPKGWTAVRHMPETFTLEVSSKPLVA
jgi:hypothetical protein